MTFDLEKARDAAKFDDRMAITMFPLAIAEIERLRAEMDNYGDDFVCQMKSKDARIDELEADNQNLVTLNKSLMNNDWILRDNNRKYRKRAQKAELLNKELKADLEQSERVVEARLEVIDQQAAKKIADNTIEILRAERDRLFNTVEQQVAEIERLRARDRQAAAAIVAMAEGAKQHVLKTHTIMKNVFDEADSLAGYCEELENIVITKDARIKELESSLDEAEALTKKNADLMNAYLARIAELEDALVEGLTNFLHYRASCYDPARRCPYAKECDDCSTWDACGHVEKFRSEARQLLQAEGKIGPDARPRSWQITEERKAAIDRGLQFLEWSYAKNSALDTKEQITVLWAMLDEAGQ